MDLDDLIDDIMGDQPMPNSSAGNSKMLSMNAQSAQ